MKMCKLCNAMNEFRSYEDVQNLYGCIVSSKTYRRGRGHQISIEEMKFFSSRQYIYKIFDKIIPKTLVKLL